MAIDGKYGIVTLQHGDIGEDEPVIVFRARDVLVPALLDAYSVLCKGAGSPERHLALIEKTKTEVVSWQTRHPNHARIPTSESSRAWMPA